MTYPFLQAKYFTVGRGKHQIRQVFIHTTESPKRRGIAWRIWHWFAGTASPQASAHFIVDPTEIEQNVKLSDTAWAVGDWLLNQTSLSIELACEAKDWTACWHEDAYLVALLNNAAKLTAELCFQFKIPAVKVLASQLPSGKMGIAGHWDVTLAKFIKGGHIDPGVGFPWPHFIGLVASHLASIK